MNTEPVKPWRMPKPVRIVRARPRLFVSALLGVAVILALPASWPISTRLLVGWDIAVALYLILAYAFIAHADVASIRKHAAVEDEGQFTILILTVAAALASLAAILIELKTPSGASREPVRLALAAATIALSWAFVHTIFALHYAHEFYDERRAGSGGLGFPGDEKPDYWDFVYFSFVIGMTSQVSDVAVTSKHIRRTVTAHGIVSFVFNVAVLALMVNIAASAI